jgi:hypothetical protein
MPKSYAKFYPDVPTAVCHAHYGLNWVDLNCNRCKARQAGIKFDALFTKPSTRPKPSPPISPNSTSASIQGDAKITKRLAARKVSRVSMSFHTVTMADETQDHQNTQKSQNSPATYHTAVSPPTSTSVKFEEQCRPSKEDLIMDDVSFASFESKVGLDLGRDKIESSAEEFAFSPIVFHEVELPVLTCDPRCQREPVKPNFQEGEARSFYPDLEQFTNWMLDPFLKESGNSQRWPAPLDPVDESEVVYSDMFALDREELPKGPHFQELSEAHAVVYSRGRREVVKPTKVSKRPKTVHAHASAKRPKTTDTPIYITKSPPKGLHHRIIPAKRLTVMNTSQTLLRKAVANSTSMTTRYTHPMSNTLQRGTLPFLAVSTANAIPQNYMSPDLDELIEREVARLLALQISSGATEPLVITAPLKTRKRKASSEIHVTGATRQRQISP